VHPKVFTIPPHRAFADALAAGLIARFGRERTGLARGIVLVPNNRAVRAIQDAFVRRSGGGLLLPRLVPVGDPELDERIGGMLEPLAGDEAPVPPAIEPELRLMLLARLVQLHLGGEAAEALRLAEDLARTLDQLLIEEIEPARLAGFAADLPELSLHWQKSLDQLQLILRDWPGVLGDRGVIDLADRRNRLLSAVAQIDLLISGGEAEASLGVDSITGAPNRRDTPDLGVLHLHTVEMQEVRHRVDAQVHAEVTEVLGLVTENLSPNIGVEAVGADYEIEHAGVAVAERDFNAVTGLGDRGDGVAEYHVDAGRPRHEDLE